MALYGHISEGTINDYLDRLDFYLEANEVTEVSKKESNFANGSRPTTIQAA